MEDFDVVNEDNNLLADNSKERTINDEDFKYKLYWYNNFSISIITQRNLKFEPKIQNIPFNVDNEINNN